METPVWELPGWGGFDPQFMYSFLLFNPLFFHPCWPWGGQRTLALTSGLASSCLQRKVDSRWKGRCPLYTAVRRQHQQYTEQRSSYTLLVVTYYWNLLNLIDQVPSSVESQTQPSHVRSETPRCLAQLHPKTQWKLNKRQESIRR